MKIKDFLRDNLSFICFYLILAAVFSLIMYFDNSIEVSVQNIFYADIVGGFLCIVYLIREYSKKKRSYDVLLRMMEQPEEDFVASLPEPITREQGLYFKLLKKTETVYHDKINRFLNEKKEFSDFINYWVHEIKTPIAGSRLVIENHHDKSKEEILEVMEDKLDSIENYTDQALYYSRLDSFSQDYLLGDISMEDLIKTIVKKHARAFIAKKIKIELNHLDFVVNSDKKWLSFIVEQILLNSLKYTGVNGNVRIRGSADENEKRIIIEDDGIGIKPEDIDRVFDKGFTGYNGRQNLKATGIGLYLCKKLAGRLGHDITIESVYSEYTRVTIHFPRLTDYFNRT